MESKNNPKNEKKRALATNLRVNRAALEFGLLEKQKEKKEKPEKV